MTRLNPLATLLLASAALVAFTGCHTTVVQPVQTVPQPEPQHYDDHHQPPPQQQPPPPPHHDDDHH